MRGRLEDLLRYCARPAISDERLSRTDRGDVCLRLKTPWYDGSTHIVYEPLDYIAKLALFSRGRTRTWSSTTAFLLQTPLGVTALSYTVDPQLRLSTKHKPSMSMRGQGNCRDV